VSTISWFFIAGFPQLNSLFLSLVCQQRRFGAVSVLGQHPGGRRRGGRGVLLVRPDGLRRRPLRPRGPAVAVLPPRAAAPVAPGGRLVRARPWPRPRPRGVRGPGRRAQEQERVAAGRDGGRPGSPAARSRQPRGRRVHRGGGGRAAVRAQGPPPGQLTIPNTRPTFHSSPAFTI
jgi:hypothetical protein